MRRYQRDYLLKRKRPQFAEQLMDIVRLRLFYVKHRALDLLNS